MEKIQSKFLFVLLMLLLVNHSSNSQEIPENVTSFEVQGAKKEVYKSFLPGLEPSKYITWENRIIHKKVKNSFIKATKSYYSISELTVSNRNAMANAYIQKQYTYEIWFKEISEQKTKVYLHLSVEINSVKGDKKAKLSSKEEEEKLCIVELNRILKFHQATNISLPEEYVKINDNEFIDERDYMKYKKVKIGNQIWMGENLNYETDSGSWYYEKSLSYGAKYGRLYNWETACKVCPSGWHLPSDAEWNELEMYLSMSQKEADTTERSILYVGDKLRSNKGWGKENPEYNESGFSALPAGLSFNNGEGFSKIGKKVNFWSSTEYSKNEAWSRKIVDPTNVIYIDIENKKYGFSVRCIKD